MEFAIIIANTSHLQHANVISNLIHDASKKRGTGIANRPAAYIAEKISSGHAVLALHKDEVAGFCYVETWGHKQYVANSGLIVAEAFRNHGLAAKIKGKAFELSKNLYPNARLFGITTSLPVMKINSALGYKPVTFSELTDDDEFWKGCLGCKNYDILQRHDHKMCLCTGMLYEPVMLNGKKVSPKNKRWEKFKHYLKSKKRLKVLKNEQK